MNKEKNIISATASDTRRLIVEARETTSNSWQVGGSQIKSKTTERPFRLVLQSTRRPRNASCMCICSMSYK